MFSSAIYKRLITVFIGTSIALPAIAKGLDELKPRTDAEKAQQAAEAAEKAPATPGTPGTPATPAATTPAAAAQPVVAKSATSKALSDKLHVAAGYGFVRVPQAKQGEYKAQGLGDISVLWNFVNAESYKFLASLRYAPFHSENEIDGQSYKSIIEGYHLGGHYLYKFLHKDLAIVALAELGYLLVYMDTRDRFAVQESSETNELLFSLGTGFEWVLMDKVNVGPRIYYGFGNIQVLQISAAVTFAF